MIQACRDKLTGLISSGRLSHSGLILQRLLRHQDDPASERMLLEAARRAQRNVGNVYRLAFKRPHGWRKELSERGNQPTNGGGPSHGPVVMGFPLTTHPGSRIIIGLGGESPLETGLTLHHIYGVPIIPGSAIKGLTAHYCDQVFGELPQQQELRRRIEFTDEKGKLRIRTGKQFLPLFGDTDDAGFITFHDAWIDPDSLTRDDEGMLLDVMTPHHGDYYGGKSYHIHGQPTPGGPRDGEFIPPTDFDNPIPVSFLSVRGTFHFVLTCTDPSSDGQKWLAWSAALVRAALADWGVGGKTSSGYGRLVEPGTSSGPSHSPEGELAATNPVSSTPKLPEPNDLVDAELTECREKSVKGVEKISWRARHLASGISGPIQNSEAVPPDSNIGGRLQLYVAYASPQEIGFRFPTPTVREQVAKSQAKAKLTSSGKSQQRGDQRRR